MAVLDNLIDQMIDFKLSISTNQKIPVEEFIVSQEEAEAVIAKTYIHESKHEAF